RRLPRHHPHGRRPAARHQAAGQVARQAEQGPQQHKRGQRAPRHLHGPLPLPL
ncbi:hypothetical protein BN1708_020359, partial [Verticillium longisporum]